MAYKILTNVPVTMKFKYDTFKEWDNTGNDGKSYKSYSGAVLIDGQEEYFNIYEREYNQVFQPLEPLAGRTLEVLKYEDGKYKAWKVMENGIEITPNKGSGTQTPSQPQNVSQVPKQDNTALIEALNKVIKKVKDHERRIAGLETLAIGSQGEDALTLHQSTNTPEEAEDILTQSPF